MKSKLCNGGIIAEIPEDFLPNEKCGRYPYGNRPPVIMSNEELGMDITFNYLRKPLSQNSLEAAIKSVILLLEGSGSVRKVSGYHFFQGTNVKGVWIDFVSRGIYSDSHNYLAVFPIHSRFAMGTISAPFNGDGREKEIFLDMIRSITDGEK